MSLRRFAETVYENLFRQNFIFSNINRKSFRIVEEKKLPVKEKKDYYVTPKKIMEEI